MNRRDDTFEAPKGKEYAGPSGIARESMWLTHEDLVEGRDITVAIEKVILYPSVKFEGGRVRLNLIGLKFADKERILGLNATNRKVLGAMFGSLAKNWKGQKVTLFVTETEAWGDTVKCVRIRKQGVRAATAAEQFLAEDDDPKATTAPANGADINDPVERERLLNESGDDGELGLSE